MHFSSVLYIWHRAFLYPLIELGVEKLWLMQLISTEKLFNFEPIYTVYFSQAFSFKQNIINLNLPVMTFIS